MTQLSDLVGYRLHMADLAALQDARAALAGRDLTPANVTVLVFVRDNPGCDQVTLGRLLSVNRSSAMKLVDKLAARSLLERRPGRDLRCNALHLTAQGARTLRTVLGLLQRADERLCADLDTGERDQLLHLLGRLCVPTSLPDRQPSTRGAASGPATATTEERTR